MGVVRARVGRALQRLHALVPSGDPVIVGTVYDPATVPGGVWRTWQTASMKLDQQGPFRSAPELARYRTPLRGLYIAGASTRPGPGVHGVTGKGAAEMLIADLSLLRFWR